MNTSKVTRVATAGVLALGLAAAAPAWADGGHDRDGLGPVAFIAGLVTGAVVSPYVVAPPRPVYYAPPPVAYAPPPAYVYAPPAQVVYAPAAPAYGYGYGYGYAPAPRWHHEGGRRAWRHDDDDDR